MLTTMLASSCGMAPGGPPQCAVPPTFASSIKPITDRVCVRCHDSDKVNAARQGAPPALNFNTYELITDKSAFADAITSGRQPPVGITPPIEITADDRMLVSVWRECGYPP